MKLRTLLGLGLAAASAAVLLAARRRPVAVRVEVEGRRPTFVEAFADLQTVGRRSLRRALQEAPTDAGRRLAQTEAPAK